MKNKNTYNEKNRLPLKYWYLLEEIQVMKSTSTLNNKLKRNIT